MPLLINFTHFYMLYIRIAEHIVGYTIADATLKFKSIPFIFLARLFREILQAFADASKEYFYGARCLFCVMFTDWKLNF